MILKIKLESIRVFLLRGFQNSSFFNSSFLEFQNLKLFNRPASYHFTDFEFINWRAFEFF